MLEVGRLEVSFAGINRNQRTLTLKNLNLENALFNLHKHQEDDLSNLAYFIQHFVPKNPDTTKATKFIRPWKVKCKSVEVKDTRFSYLNELRKHDDYQGIDFNNIELSDIQINIKDLTIDRDTITAKIKHLSLLEKSGFDVKTFSGNLQFSPVGLFVENMKAGTNNSYLDLDLSLEYVNMFAFNDFISQVMMHGNFRKTVLDMSDIGYFAPTMFSMKDIITFSGDISGTVDTLSGKNLDITYGRTTSFKGTLEMFGLPDIMTTFVKADIERLTTNAADVKSFALPGNANGIPVPDLLVEAGTVQVSGKYIGLYNSFISDLKIKSRLGSIGTKLIVRTTGPQNEIAYNGELNATRLDLGRLFGLGKSLGKTSFNLKVDGKGISKQNLNLTTKGAIHSLSFKGYEYKNINIDGNFRQQQFEGLLTMRDENLDFNFNGLVDFNEDKPIFNFTSTIHHADLFNLKLSERDSVSVISTRLNINFTGIELDNISGKVSIDSTSYTEGNQVYSLDNIVIKTSVADDGVRHLSLISDMVDAGFEGKYQFSELPVVITKYLKNYSDILPGKINFENPAGTPQVIDFWVNLKNTEQLTQLFLPQISVASNAKLSGFFHSGDNKFDLEFCADYVNISSLKLIDQRIAASSDDSLFYLDITAQKVYFTEPTLQNPTGIGLDSLKLITQFRSDSLHYDLTWNDLANLKRNAGDILGCFVLESPSRFKNHLSNLILLIDGQEWDIVPDNSIVIDKNAMLFENIGFYSNNSQLQIEGVISTNESDSLHLKFKEININNVDQLFNSQQLDVDGILNGEATITGLYGNPNFLLDIYIDKLFLNKEELGVLDLITWWNDAESALWVDLAINKKGNIGISNVLSLSGNYYPTQTTKNFDLEAQLNNLGIQLFNPFISSFTKISRESLASGQLNITGTYAKPVLEGKLKLMRTQFLINYLNTYYSLAGTVEFSENLISLNAITLNDLKGKPASCSGNIQHNYFRDFYLDLSINHNNFRLLNTTSKDNELFYGNAIASGVFKINGPFDDIQMNLVARTDAGTKIKIPISSAISVSDNDFIIFKKGEDYSAENEQSYNVNLKGMEINLDLEVTPNAELELFLPYDIGNIEGVGNGEIGIGITKRGDFSIFGDYVISKGIFSFTFENLIGRDFDIREGSKISWTGDPYDATVDIKAVYSVKTTLKGLEFQTDTAAMYSTRIEVLCIINLQNELFNPDIRFSMDFVNVSEDTKEIIFASLDTTDQSAMSQQILSLLLINSFSYTSNSPNLGASSFKLLSNQLSNWLSKLSKDFDIGINYQPGSQLSEEELEVVLRTQLFNDRLLIDGNFGVKGSSANQNTSNVVGDINVEYKMTQDGRFRVKAFNRTNNLSFFDDNAPYTQGVGLFYRREFDRFGDLLGNSSKNKKPPSPASGNSNQEAVIDTSLREED